MNDTIQTIQNRRSIRKYKPEQIKSEQLEIILLAATFAPSAGARQSAVFAVCQNMTLNTEIGNISVNNLKALLQDGQAEKANGEKGPTPQVVLDSAKRNSFYGAPTVVTIFAPRGKYNYTLDCAVAAENMMLAAASVGVGSCIVARAIETFNTERGKQIQSDWGIAEEYEAKLHVLLGYAEGEITKPKPRRDGRIHIIS